MSDTKVEPALTAEEWADWANREWFPSVSTVIDVTTLDARDRHKAGALALHGQPFGFTREDLACLRVVMGSLEHHGIGQPCLEPLYDRIEALLPPEDE